MKTVFENISRICLHAASMDWIWFNSH